VSDKPQTAAGYWAPLDLALKRLVEALACGSDGSVEPEWAPTPGQLKHLMLRAFNAKSVSDEAFEGALLRYGPFLSTWRGQ
jgi:hypothetical protein